MRKSFRLICLGFVFAFICAGMALMCDFPVDTRTFVENKYSGWNGVLQIWICSNWNPGGGFIRWLNSCASYFEKMHEGVYLEFTPVQQESIRNMHTGTLHLPDLVLFSPGVINTPEILTDLYSDKSIRSDLIDYGQGKAVPVALGGYIWAYNTALCSDVPRTPTDFSLSTLPMDADGRCYSAALLGLLSGTSDTSDTEYDTPELGIDLGLPASAAGSSPAADNALDLFIDGELPFFPVNAQDIALLSRLSEGGRGPDWKTAISGDIACTDQILLAAIPEQKDHSERSTLTKEFIAYLLQQDAQDALADIHAFSVIGANIHPGFSDYAELDTLLNSRPIWLPGCFSEYSVSNSEAIVRRFLNREISAKNALHLLSFEGM